MNLITCASSKKIMDYSVVDPLGSEAVSLTYLKAFKRQDKHYNLLSSTIRIVVSIIFQRNIRSYTKRIIITVLGQIDTLRNDVSHIKMF